MSRKRASKGAVIVHKDKKLGIVIGDVGVNADFDTFLEAFQSTYPKDWARVCSRYEEHERLNQGKSHPMAEPPKYMETAFNSFHKKLQKNGQTPEDFLEELKRPRSKTPQV